MWVAEETPLRPPHPGHFGCAMHSRGGCRSLEPSAARTHMIDCGGAFQADGDVHRGQPALVKEQIPSQQLRPWGAKPALRLGCEKEWRVSHGSVVTQTHSLTVSGDGRGRLCC